MAIPIIEVNTAAELGASLKRRGVAIDCPAHLAEAFGFSVAEDVGTELDLDAAAIEDAPPEGGF